MSRAALEEAQAIENHQQGSSHIGSNGGPKVSKAEKRQSHERASALAQSASEDWGIAMPDAFKPSRISSAVFSAL